ncbi:MAG TPA: hypothetical protein VN668_15585 [Stellaceae bacterium]|nr:hypothetical protein [Stellaceae bacterium]
MPSPSPEVVVENLRRTLHGNIAHYAALRLETLSGGVEDELVELALMLGLECTADRRQPLGLLLDSLCEAAREDQQATYEQREAARSGGVNINAVPAMTASVDRWLERWLSARGTGRLPPLR